MTGRYPALRCKSCGYRVPFLGSPWEQAERAVDHFEAFHAGPEPDDSEGVAGGVRLDVSREERAGRAEHDSQGPLDG